MSERFEYMENEKGCGIWDNDDRKEYNLEFGLHYKVNVKSMCKKANELWEENNELREENARLKQELKYIYDIATLNKAIDLLDKIYDEYLWASPSDESAAAKRDGMKKCIDALQDYKEDLE